MTLVVLAGIAAYLFAAAALRPSASVPVLVDHDTVAAPDQAERRARDLAWVLALIGVAAHLAHHVQTFRAAGGLDLHFFSALSWVGLALAIAATAFAPSRRMGMLGVVILPLAAAMLLFDHAFGAPTASGNVGDWRIALHAWLALLAYATLTISALIAICAWLQDRALRTHRFSPLSQRLPPLMLIERLLFQTITAGFVLLSLTMLTGALFVEDMLAQHLAHKSVLTLLSWLTFGALLFGRWRFGWRGRRAVQFTLWGFALLMLAFFGSKFVLELVLQRS